MKNKLNFFLSALLVLLFGMGLNTCSYASQPSLEEMTNFIELIKVKQNNGELFTSNKITGNSTSIATQFLNLTTDIDYTLENVVFLPGRLFNANGSWVSTSQGVLVIANNTFSDTLPFLYIQYQAGGTPMLYTTTASGSNWANFYSIQSSNVVKYNNCSQLHYDSGSYTWSPNSELTVLTNNVIFTKLKTASIYVKYSGQFYPMLNNYGGQNYNEYYGISEEPEEPEQPDNPDVPGTGGTTGNITNPSGDTTGKVDLSGIENSLNNIENKIPTSGDIKDSQVQGNKEFWGNAEEINAEDFENELENNFNGIMENLSGELTQNQIFESLQGAENGFLNFFKEEQNEQFYDLAFSWPNVEFMGEILIPAGGINISEMCREIPELETLRSYIRVIFNFSVAVALIKQIYNLILSTLGIDNPYLYEDYDEVTSINEDTGEYRQTAVRRKKIYNRRR